MPCRFWGGPERQTVQAARILRDRGACEVSFAVIPHREAKVADNPLVVGARAEGFEAEPLALARGYDLLEGARRLRAIAARLRPDVVCTVGYKADLLALGLRGRGAPRVLAVARGWTGEDLKVRLFEWADRRTLRWHDGVVVVSEAQRAAVRACGVSEARIFHVPNAIDLDRMPPPVPRARLLAELGLDASVRLVGAVGRISPEKGQRSLVEAFAAVARADPRAALVLVGDGPDEAAVRADVAARGLGDRARLLGLRRDGAQLIGALDVLALPSRTEGLPNVVLEAFAYGTPVVASAVGGVPELVLDGETGWLVPPGRPDALARALLDALARPEEAGARATRARARLLSRFTAERQADAWLEAIAAVTGAVATGAAAGA
ncbi:glycosyltransferase [Sorangium cellulosum]|uniref:Glycosyltransferase subfamily 4-like N-terminal domain-containing protein n=1 Tax=Sorangium cellulosum So0157-2 TaxID=1254432 RepID=S4XNH3_SORCE|nr:glycosyltransferase [Sorangium cellulosum]AGP33320.1 hypothetical protein SCE1572_01620 [Sorangium cellulosum So0157-2]